VRREKVEKKRKEKRSFTVGEEDEESE